MRPRVQELLMPDDEELGFSFAEESAAQIPDGEPGWSHQPSPLGPPADLTPTYTTIGAAGAEWMQKLRAKQSPEGSSSSQSSASPPPATDECPVCHGVGYVVSGPRFNWEAVPCPRCHKPQLDAQEQQRRSMWTDWAAIASQTFETFGPFRQGPAGEACRAAMAFAGQPQGWFVLTGSAWREQNHLAAAIANESRQRRQTIYVAAPDLLDMLQPARRYKGGQRPTTDPMAGWAQFIEGKEPLRQTQWTPPSYDEIMAATRECALLVLVDLDRIRKTPWAQERIYLIVNHRYNYAAPSVFTYTEAHYVEPRALSRLQDWQLLFQNQGYGLNAAADPAGRRHSHRARRS